MDAISLYKLQEQIRRVIALNFPEPIFIKAEISRVTNSRGHYYLELADKDNEDEHVKAKAQAVIWRNTAAQLKNKFKDQFEEILQEGLQIAFHARIQFHEVYGLKLVIEEIDLEYSLGVVAKERADILQLLEKEGLLDLNGQLVLPAVIQRIAVVSSPTAAGYSDFLDSIINNPYDLKFDHTLFPSAMQGLAVETEMLEQLEKIDQQWDEYDVVVIIRGGGGKLDLAYFDNYRIGKSIAGHHLPVLTGIGHQIDETVTDRVSHSSFKTPTAVAEFLIQHNLKVLQNLQEMTARIGNITGRIIENEAWKLRTFKRELQNRVQSFYQDQYLNLKYSRKELRNVAKQVIEQQFKQLKHTKERVQLLDPKNVLERGFTAAEQDNRRVTSKTQLDTKKQFSLFFFDGKIEIEPND